MKQVLILLTFVLVFPFISKGAICTIDNTMDPNGPLNTTPAGVIIGQQFTACETGSVAFVTVDVRFQSAAGGDLDLYLVNGNGSTITSGGAIKTFSGLTDGVQTLSLNTGDFIVQKGATYAFAISGTQLSQVILDNTPIGTPTNPSLPDGLFSFSINGGAFSEQMPSDLFFAVGIDFTSIPSMSEWGLLIFGLLVLNLSVFFIKEKETKLKAVNSNRD